MEAPIIEGNKKKIKVVSPFNRPLIPIGELTINEDPVLTVNESNNPADAPARKMEKRKNIAR